MKILTVEFVVASPDHQPTDPEAPVSFENLLLENFGRKIEADPGHLREIAAQRWAVISPLERRAINLVATSFYPHDIVARGEFCRNLLITDHFRDESTQLTGQAIEIEELKEVNFPTEDNPTLPA